jgi:hypothetical protein
MRVTVIMIATLTFCSKTPDTTEKDNDEKLICSAVFAKLLPTRIIGKEMEMVSSDSVKNEVQDRSSAKSADLQRLFDELESTGTVTLDIPNPYSESDASLLAWLKSGFVE